MFSYVDIEGLIPDGDPIRKVRKVVDEALLGMGDVFEAMYAETGRPSIPPEQLLRALVVQIIHTVRSERQLMPHSPRTGIGCLPTGLTSAFWRR